MKTSWAGIQWLKGRLEWDETEEEGAGESSSKRYKSWGHIVSKEKWEAIESF